jgi:hypothetical protein
MGGRALRFLDDVSQAGLYLRVTCGGCGREAIFSAFTMRDYCRYHRITTELGALEAKLRCDQGGTGCGHRGAKIVPIDWPPPEPPSPTLVDLKQIERERQQWKVQQRY